MNHIENSIVSRLGQHRMNYDDLQDLRQLARIGIVEAQALWAAKQMSGCEEAFVMTVAKRYVVDRMGECGQTNRARMRTERRDAEQGRELWINRWAYLQEDSTASTHQLLERMDLIRKLDSALDQLPDDEGEIVRAVYLEERSVADVALERGVSRSHVYNVLNRSMTALRRSLVA